MWLCGLVKGHEAGCVGVIGGGEVKHLMHSQGGKWDFLLSSVHNLCRNIPLCQFVS